MSLKYALAFVAGSLLACGPQPETEGQTTAREDLKVCPSGFCSGRVQAGTNLIVLGVTSENYAIYQDGDALYSTLLKVGAPKALVTTLGGHTPFVFTVGPVAFIWTANDGAVPAPQSPLIVFTAKTGARRLTEKSIVATLGVAADAQGSQVLYFDNANASATTADLVLANLPLGTRQVLAGAINADYNHQGQPGDCRPMVGFANTAPVAAFCQQGTSTASLGLWANGRGTTLANNLSTPPMWSTDRQGALFLTAAAGTHAPVLVTSAGLRKPVDATSSEPRWSFLTPDGDAVFTVIKPTGNEVWVQRANSTTSRRLATLSNTGMMWWNLHEGLGGFSADFRPYHDGNILLAPTSDASSGLSSLSLVTINGRVRTLSANTECGFAGPMVASDVDHGYFYYEVIDPNTGNVAYRVADDQVTLIAPGTSAIPNHQPLYSGAAYLTDATVTNPNLYLNEGTINVFTLDPVIFSIITNDTLRPTVLARGAHLNFFPSHGGMGLAFTSEHESEGPGLYLKGASSRHVPY